MSLSCYKCGHALSETFKIMVGRRDICPNCSTDIRCCRMCQFYDPKSYNECKETSADKVAEKEKANFCDYFKISGVGTHPNKEREEALARANALFKK